jgi:hypothetical protein
MMDMCFDPPPVVETDDNSLEGKTPEEIAELFSKTPIAQLTKWGVQ